MEPLASDSDDKQPLRSHVSVEIFRLRQDT